MTKDEMEVDVLAGAVVEAVPVAASAELRLDNFRAVVIRPSQLVRCFDSSETAVAVVPIFGQADTDRSQEQFRGWFQDFAEATVAERYGDCTH